VAALKDPGIDVRKAAGGALEALGWQPDRTEAGESRTV
jgi:hypothetical protein